MIGREANRCRHAKRRAQQRSQRQHRGKYAARCAGGEAQHGRDNPRDKHKQQQPHAEIPRRGNGNQAETAARRVRFDEAEDPAHAAKQAPHQHPFRGISAMDALKHILSP